MGKVPQGQEMCNLEARQAVYMCTYVEKCKQCVSHMVSTTWCVCGVSGPRGRPDPQVGGAAPGGGDQDTERTTQAGPRQTEYTGQSHTPQHTLVTLFSVPTPVLTGKEVGL